MELKSDKEQLNSCKISKDKLSKIITMILAGLLLLIIVIPIGEDEGKNTEGVEDGLMREAVAGDASYYEERLEDILENSYGADTMDVMVHMKEVEAAYDVYGGNTDSNYVVDGILIVADVTDETAIGDISFAVCALFDLPAHKVAVIKK